ncbi:hypothetical protein, partial [Salmonella enterica]|uniref:hypothetical protein n=1 Tax=Salmonella enterica TaxID=28901 RepID=UPI001C394C57
HYFVGWQRGGANSDGRADVDIKSTRCTLTLFITQLRFYLSPVYLTIFHFHVLLLRHTRIALVKMNFIKSLNMLI